MEDEKIVSDTVAGTGGRADFTPGDYATRTELLEGSPVFTELPDRALRLLARRMQRMEVAAGDTVIDVGERNDRIYFIASGVCESAVADGVASTWVQKLARGAEFGLAAAVLETQQPVRVTADERSVLYYLASATVRVTLSEVAGAVEGLERLAQQQLEQARQAQLRATSTVRPRPDAVVIPVYSASGGSGRTTVALNLGAGLAADAPGRVLLIDLSVPYPQACLMANLIPMGSIATMNRPSGVSMEKALLASALYHPSGMMVLPAATRADEAELVTPELVDQTLTAMKDTFSYVIVDMPVALGDFSIPVFDKAQQVVLVLTPDLGALRGANEAMNILDNAFGIPPQLVSVVLNNRSPKAATSRGAIARALGRSPDIEIRYDEDRPEKASLHGSLPFQDPRSALRPAMLELVARVTSLCVAPDLRAVAAGIHGRPDVVSSNG